jgi:predicted MPP superfamily phosphohydrolase
MIGSIRSRLASPRAVVPDISRRSALKAFTALAAGTVGGAVFHGYAFERHALGLTQVELAISGLPSVFDGLRVGFITDLHHSALVGVDDIQRAASLVAATKPDLVLLGGDYVSYFDRRYAAPCAEVLGTLTAPLGVFAVLGNHDDDRFVPAALKARGIAVLRDEWTSISRRGASFVLAGIEFWTRTAPEIARVLAGATGPVLLAAHDPRRLQEAADLDVGGVLAGHTHGGQVVLPIVGAPFARKFPIAAGRIRRENTEMFVSRGVGTVILPLRVNCPPEVALVTLRSRGDLG